MKQGLKSGNAHAEDVGGRSKGTTRERDKTCSKGPGRKAAHLELTRVSRDGGRRDRRRQQKPPSDGRQ
ncbi:hypothetical protein ACI65C_009429 [Semiaphis heraclei]